MLHFLDPYFFSVLTKVANFHAVIISPQLAPQMISSQRAMSVSYMRMKASLGTDILVLQVKSR